MSLLNINQIKRYLPHRYPFLFVDAVEELVVGETIRAKKAVTGNEAFFEGHFPGSPVVPGVIQVEAMQQTAALLAILSGAKVGQGRTMYVAGIEACKFKRPVVPGDVMELSAKITRKKLGTWKFDCEVHVGGQLASKASVTAAAGPIPGQPDLPEGLPPPPDEEASS